jgi:hypothetical protein
MLLTETEDRLRQAETRMDQAEAAIRTVGHLIETVRKAQGTAHRAGKGMRLASLILLASSGVAVSLLLLVRTPTDASAASDASPDLAVTTAG